MKKFFTTALILLAITTAFAKGPKNQYVRVKTSYGECIIRLYNETPKHSDNFIKLVKQGFEGLGAAAFLLRPLIDFIYLLQRRLGKSFAIRKLVDRFPGTVVINT